MLPPSAGTGAGGEPSTHWVPFASAPANSSQQHRRCLHIPTALGFHYASPFSQGYKDKDDDDD